MRSIVVGSDLGSRSDAVIRSGAHLALGSGAALHVVHALDLIGLPLREATPALERGIDRQAHQALQEQIDRVLMGCAAAAMPVVDYRSPPVAIVQRAEATDADLIVLGAAGDSGGRSHLPDVIARVVAWCTRPLLVIRDPPQWPPRTVLCPVEDAPITENRIGKITQWLHRACPGPATTTTREQPTELHVLYAGGEGEESPDHAMASIRAAGREWAEGLRITTISNPRRGCSPASPATLILEWAERDAADLILLTRYDNTLIRLPDRTWYQVILRAPCSVCLLPEAGLSLADPAGAEPESDGPLEQEMVLATSA